ncbi:hypothetical protein V9T40_005184 [Parthenolecanium corni]|uniref:Integrase catalytic domain-containing protein n=1 Tax=Parthenolecanium corni TaxID=536013 RepID=A0AAN9Y2E8_9HEMI
MKKNGVNHIFTPPYHPQSNGAAENCVSVFKDKIKKAISSGVEIFDAIQQFLLDFRTTVHCTTNKTPAELHVNRKLRTRFDIFVNRKLDTQKFYFNGKKEVTAEVGDKVMARDYKQLIHLISMLSTLYSELYPRREETKLGILTTKILWTYTSKAKNNF